MKSKKVAKKKDESLVVSDGNFIFCDSRMVAEKFEVKHANVIKVIERIKGKNDQAEAPRNGGSNGKFDPIFLKYEDRYQGQKFVAYRMNKTAFSLISMRFDTQTAFLWQRKFAMAFAQMESEILQLRSILSANRSDPEWLESRHAGKGVHRGLTDTVKILVEYAIGQGSEHAGMYFTSISKMINKALFIISPHIKNVRDALDSTQIKHLSTAEYIADVTIQGELAMDAHYKSVYPKVKSKVETFAQKIGRTPVPIVPQLTGPSQCPLIGMEKG